MVWGCGLVRMIPTPQWIRQGKQEGQSGRGLLWRARRVFFPVSVVTRRLCRFPFRWTLAVLRTDMVLSRDGLYIACNKLFENTASKILLSENSFREASATQRGKTHRAQCQRVGSKARQEKAKTSEKARRQQRQSKKNFDQQQRNATEGNTTKVTFCCDPRTSRISFDRTGCDDPERTER